MANTPVVSQVNIDSTLQETRVFPPLGEFARQRHTSRVSEEYERIHNEAKC